MTIDMPGYGMEATPYEKHEFCACGKTHRSVSSNKVCEWCECDDHEYDEHRDRELIEGVEE